MTDVKSPLPTGFGFWSFPLSYFVSLLNYLFGSRTIYRHPEAALNLNRCTEQYIRFFSSVIQMTNVESKVHFLFLALPLSHFVSQCIWL